MCNAYSRYDRIRALLRVGFLHACRAPELFNAKIVPICTRRPCPGTFQRQNCSDLPRFRRRCRFRSPSAGFRGIPGPESEFRPDLTTKLCWVPGVLRNSSLSPLLFLDDCQPSAVTNLPSLLYIMSTFPPMCLVPRFSTIQYATTALLMKVAAPEYNSCSSGRHKMWVLHLYVTLVPNVYVPHLHIFLYNTIR